MSIVRDQILARAHAVPLGVISYSQTRTNTYTGRRSDCSGWVSYCWDTPAGAPGTYLGAFSTATFVTAHQVVEVPFAELRPGDAIGYCSPTSPGNGGHIALWLSGHDPRGSLEVLDHGSGMGPKHRTVRWDGVSTGWLHPNHLRAWRYVGIIDQSEEIDMDDCKWGDGTAKVPDARVTKLQTGLVLAGQKVDVDGVYRDQTATALVALGVCGGDQTGHSYGPTEQWLLQAAVARGRLGQGVTLAIGTVTTGEPGSQATAQIVDGKLNLTLPRGAKGDRGDAAVLEAGSHLVVQ